MKWSKKFLAVAAAMTMAFAAAGCGGGDNSGNAGGSDSADVEALLTKAQETMAGVESMATEMNMEISMAMGEESIDMITNAKILTVNEPLKMQMDMSMDMGEMGSQDMQMFAEEKDGQFVTYINMDGAWYAQSATAESLAQYDADANMDLYLKNISGFSKTGEEDVNGKTASKIEGVLTGDAMKEAIQDSGALISVENMGLSTEDMEALYSSDLPLTMWIDADGYVVKYEMDMTAMMQAVMDQAMASAGAEAGDAKIEISKTAVSMICKDFNAVEVEIPAEAANATVIG